MIDSNGKTMKNVFFSPHAIKLSLSKYSERKGRAVFPENLQFHLRLDRESNSRGQKLYKSIPRKNYEKECTLCFKENSCSDELIYS